MARLVYFSSATDNTERFVRKLDMPACRIPLHPEKDPLRVDEKYVLVIPTYRGGDAKGTVPKQVIEFLSGGHNRSLICGVIPGENMNFSTAYGLAGNIVAAKYHVPHMYRFELLGTPLDVAQVREGLEKS